MCCKSKIIKLNIVLLFLIYDMNTELLFGKVRKSRKLEILHDGYVLFTSKFPPLIFVCMVDYRS